MTPVTATPNGRKATAADQLRTAMVNDPGLIQELGTTGLEQYGGLIHEEFLRKLQGRLGLLAFREMELNDPIVGAMLYALEMLMRSVNWNVEPYEEGAEDDKNAQFVEEVFEDMAHSWGGFIGEWMSAPVYGYAPFEIVWKDRNGYHRDPALSSKYSDGRLGIKKLAIRHPVTLERWLIDEATDSVVGMEQLHNNRRATIPAEKLLLFTTLQRKGNPEGTSLLRRCFIPYFRKKHIEEIEGIGIERELAGLPMLELPPNWFLSNASADEKALLAYAKQLLRRLKTDEQMGILLPRMLNDKGHELVKFTLVSSGGRRAIDTGPAKDYYSRHMAMSILMDVIMIGHEKVGSFALASSKTNLLGISVGALLDGIEEVFNRHLIPQLMELNGMDPARAPKLKHGDIETPDLEVLGTFVNTLSAAGLQLFPSRSGELERFLLRAANLPEDVADESPDRFDEAEEMREAQKEALAAAGGQGGMGVAPGKQPPKPGQPDGGVQKYDPDQPRDPAGTATGGQWTADSGGPKTDGQWSGTVAAIGWLEHESQWPESIPMWSGDAEPPEDYRYLVDGDGELADVEYIDPKALKGTEKVNPGSVRQMVELLRGDEADLPPVIVERDDEGYFIVDGHTRHAAALELGLPSIPIREYLTAR